jgi:uncharacterized protein with ParB-like and HNH nuclease domain
MPTTESKPNANHWFDEEDDINNDDFQVREYEVTASPNDFNLSTLVSFIESGAIKIPGFQRNYVWDLKRASKLIESIIIGLPIPQIFLYEEARNSFLVIDGQQRLMSLYYFWKGRFPRKEKRIELRAVFDEQGHIPVAFLDNDEYFVRFKLQLPENLPNHPNKLNRLTYQTLEEFQTTFNLRTIRNVIIRQNTPAGDDSAMFEIFNRLNSGGVNLKPQEIRTSLYHSEFYKLIYKLNALPDWRGILGIDVPDLNMKDCEILLRGFAMLISSEEYAPSMTKFLNDFSRKMKNVSPERLAYLERLFGSFLDACASLPPRIFYTGKGRFNISIFESVFNAVCEEPFAQQELVARTVHPELIASLKEDTTFMEAAQKATAGTSSVETRLRIAREKLAL